MLINCFYVSFVHSSTEVELFLLNPSEYLFFSLYQHFNFLPDNLPVMNPTFGAARQTAILQEALLSLIYKRPSYRPTGTYRSFWKRDSRFRRHNGVKHPGYLDIYWFNGAHNNKSSKQKLQKHLIKL